jgi:hypothetical protein
VCRHLTLTTPSLTASPHPTEKCPMSKRSAGDKKGVTDLRGHRRRRGILGAWADRGEGHLCLPGKRQTSSRKPVPPPFSPLRVWCLWSWSLVGVFSSEGGRAGHQASIPAFELWTDVSQVFNVKSDPKVKWPRGQRRIRQKCRPSVPLMPTGPRHWRVSVLSERSLSSPKST